MAAGTQPPSSKFTSSQELRGCYEFDEGHIRKLAAVIARAAVKAPSIEMVLWGRTKLESEDLDVILSDTIIERHPIKSITISVYNTTDAGNIYARIAVEDTAASGPVSISVSGRKEPVVSLRAEIDDILSSARKWYSPLNYSGNILIYLLTPMIFLIASGVLNYYAFTAMPARWFADSQSIAQFSFFISTSITWTLFLWGQYYLFPRLVIRVGAGIRRRALQARIAGLLFGTIIGGIILAVISNKLTDWLFAKP